MRLLLLIFISMTLTVYSSPINDTTLCRSRQKPILLKAKNRNKTDSTTLSTPSPTQVTDELPECETSHNKCKVDGYVIAMTFILTALFAIVLGLLLFCIQKCCIRHYQSEYEC